jgi:hypothetical protein
MSKARVIESPVEAMEFGYAGAAPADMGSRPAMMAKNPIRNRTLGFISSFPPPSRF